MTMTQRVFLRIVAKGVGVFLGGVGVYLLVAWGLSFWLDWREANGWAMVLIMITAVSVMGLRAAWDRAEYITYLKAQEVFDPLRDKN